MHPRNRHQDRYDFTALVKALPELRPYIVISKFGTETIDFTNQAGVKALNKAILKHSYGINYWDIPEQFLCPPIPGRADYIHVLADLIGKTKPDSSVRVLDIGTGANCIYPLLGYAEYQWSFVGSDIHEASVKNAKKIVSENNLEKIEIRLQKEKTYFAGIVLPGESFTLSMCNPPFHESLADAHRGTERKWKNLAVKKKATDLNFGGKDNELWTPGGEKNFVTEMIKESALFKDHCLWFTTLVSKDTNLPVYEKLLKTFPVDVRILPMEQGQKKSRVLAWSFQRKISG